MAALLRPKVFPGTTPRVAVVTQPASPGHSPLPGTVEEATIMQRIAGEHKVQVDHLSANQATLDVVSGAMATYNWVHLTCHGIHDVDSPLQSAFILQDGKLPLGMLMGKTLENAQLAFLSACQTATGDIELPNESVHLTAGMLVSGFPSVVGTMWSIGDSDAPVIVEAFYARLWKEEVDLKWGKRPDASSALQWAVQDLRKMVGNSESGLVKWVPFVHFGC